MKKALTAKIAENSLSFQQRVQPWLLACFGELIAGDREERNHRFLEESLELVQSCGCSASEAHQLVDYVFGRPVGEPRQEVGGVAVTLAALCLANDLDFHEAAEIELARIWTMVDAIRAKQAAKPKHSPLPTAIPAPSSQPNYERMFNAACTALGELSEALEVPEDEAASANGNDLMLAKIRQLIAAQPPIQIAAPFMFGIQDSDGKPYFNEGCVSSLSCELDEAVFYLNDEEEEGPYKVVALFTTQPAAPIEQAAPSERSGRSTGKCATTGCLNWRES